MVDFSPDLPRSRSDATFRDILIAAKSRITEIDTATGERLRDAGAALLDVREPDEVEQGAIPGAIHIPRGHLEANIENRLPGRETPIVVFCAGGVRSAFAAETMQSLGYTNVASMDGGFNKWKDEGRPWATPRVLSPEQRNRYHRHLLLPEVGEEGQMRLLDARILCLGRADSARPRRCTWRPPASARSRRGPWTSSTPPNLQRQILHNVDRVGERKVDSAKKTLTALNPT